MEKQSNITIIVDALQRVNNETTQLVMSISKEMSKTEIITLFNQSALDFFKTILEITKSIEQEKEYGINGYINLFETATKINVHLPIEQFAATILEFAPEIYAENENLFLDMHIPDAEFKAGNEFNIIKSDKFKHLWKTGTPKNKELVKEKIIALTTWCHVYFFQTIIQNQ